MNKSPDLDQIRPWHDAFDLFDDLGFGSRINLFKFDFK